MNRMTLYLSTGLLTIVVLGLSIFAWTQGLGASVDRYDVFPLLGLLAFGLMWMHYVSGSLKRSLGLAHTSYLKQYFTVTSTLVLGLILLHPGLLYSGLYSDGFGLPPLSAFEAYPQTAARIGILMGEIALLLFLLFELKRWLSQKSWWHVIEYLSIAGMGLIFIHGLLLGGELMTGWFRIVWILMGGLLALSIMYQYHYDKKGDFHATQ